MICPADFPPRTQNPASKAAAERAPSPALLLTAKETAVAVRLGVRTIYRLLSAGDFPAPVKVPGVRSARWRVEDLADWAQRLSTGYARPGGVKKLERPVQ